MTKTNPAPNPRPKPERKARPKAAADGGPQWKGQASPHKLVSMPTLTNSRAEESENGVGMKSLSNRTEEFSRVPASSVINSILI